MPLLTAKDLAKPVFERRNANRETYREIYRTISDRIGRTHRNGCTETVAEVPEFVLGRPVFNHAHAIRYVVEKFQRGGLKVVARGGVLHIEWGSAIQKLLKRQRRLDRDKRRKIREAKRDRARRKNETLSDRLRRINAQL
jgi:hypothetical protein